MATSISVRKHGGLTIRIDRAGESLAVRAAGELDIASAPALEDSLLHALESGASSIVLDLTSVGFIDSAGMRMVLWAAGRSDQKEDRLRTRCGACVTRRMLGLTGRGHALPPVA